MKYYELSNKEMPWHECGEVLLTGLTCHFEREYDLLQLSRTGPFQPNMTIPAELIVTDTMKYKLSNSGFEGINFLRVIKRHITFIDWTNWDLKAKDPQFYPKYGNPENYLLDLPHSEEVSEKMENVWEVIVPVNGRFIDKFTFNPDNKLLDLMVSEKRFDNTIRYIVTEKMKNWLEQNQADWICFKEIKNIIR